MPRLRHIASDASIVARPHRSGFSLQRIDCLITATRSLGLCASRAEYSRKPTCPRLDSTRLALDRTGNPGPLRNPAQSARRFALLARALIIAMYKIIGGDQKQYGPVSTDEVRAWIAEGRLSAQSLAWAEGDADWKPLGAFPEFADALRAKAAPQFPQAALPPGMAPAFEAQIFALPPQLRIGRCLERSWALWKSNFALISLGCLVYGLIGLCQLIPGVGFIYWIFSGVFEGGLYLIFIRRIRGQPAAVSDVFAGFSVAFVQLLLAGVVSGVLGAIGVFCCCVLPGIYLLIAWTFGVPLVIDKKLEFWSALELSR